MKLIVLALASLIGGVAVSSSALAEERVVARLRTPVSSTSKIIVGDAVFNCADDICQATAPMSQTFAMATCKAIAARFGTVVSFTGVKAYAPARLAECNTGAAPRGNSALGLIL